MRTTFAITACIAVGGPAMADQLDVPAEFSTIQSAIDASTDGDLVLVAPGVYRESVDFRGKRIEVRAAEGASETVIDGSVDEGSVILFVNFEGPQSILDGFSVTGGTGTDAGGLIRGGGIFVQSASPTIRNCRIENNSAGAGGGIAVWTGNPWLFDCVIENNVANASGTGGGGGLHAYSSFPRLVSVEFRSNRGDGFASGGAASLRELSGAEFVNCLIVDNEGRFCGGIYNHNSVVEISNSTFSQNQATNSSSGEAFQVIGPSAVGVAMNCIFWDNGDPDEADEMGVALGEMTILNSCVQGGWEGEGNVEVNPAFVDPEAGDFHLKADSPLIDAGENEFIPDDITMDLAHNPRFANPDNPEIVEPNVDLGPFELQPDGPPPCEGDTDGDQMIGLGDLLTVLSEWGSCGSSTGCAGDIDADGFIGLADLLAVLAGWGDCPQ